MTETYLVKLRPHSHYYFGGEYGLGEGDRRNYLVFSRQWPQQTTLLGMVRYRLLQAKGWLAEPGKPIPDKEAAASLIGEKGFRLPTEEQGLKNPQDFGVIKKLSPIFLMKKDESYLRAYPASALDASPIPKASIWRGGSQEAFQAAYVLKDFDPKKGLSQKLYGQTSGDCLKSGEPFQEEPQIGIHKHGTEQAFYKQTFYRMAQDWTFAFYLTVEDCEVNLAESVAIPFGGEKCLFQWQATRLEAGLPSELSFSYPSADGAAESLPPKEKILLLSDAWVPHEVLAQCDFAITQTVDFRFLQTNLKKTTSYAEISQGEQKDGIISKSGKYSLIAAGSVLFPKAAQPAEVQGKLGLARFQQIGYNHFQLLK
ncbi:MAG: type III-B CRISPR module-associated Cmr3 family protein [Bacteroidota bacterium]